MQEGEYRPADLQRLDIYAHGKPVDALARLVHRVRERALGKHGAS
jgi:translation elongation factor EF-4